MELNTILQGDSLEVLKTMETNSIDCCITSPPYYAQRDYGIDGQLGLEETFQEYIEKLITNFNEVKRVLKNNGTCWVNIGDCYNNKNYSGNISPSGFQQKHMEKKGIYYNAYYNKFIKKKQIIDNSIKRKSLLLLPSRFALAMIDNGWILRNDIIWHKRNCIPESVTDRFTTDFEHIYFFVKQQKYYFNQIKEPSIDSESYTGNQSHKAANIEKNTIGKTYINRNKRCVWDILTSPLKDVSHFAPYPEKLIRIPIKAGCPEHGVILDPFMGSGTTGLVAMKMNRNYIGIELNNEYIKLANKRIENYTNQNRILI